MICLAPKGESLPFDIVDQFTLFFDNDMKGVVDLQEKLRKTIESVLSVNTIDENPIINGIKEFSLIVPENTEIQVTDAIKQIFSMMGELNAKVSNIQRISIKNRNLEEIESYNYNQVYETAFSSLEKHLGRFPTCNEYYEILKEIDIDFNAKSTKLYDDMLNKRRNINNNLL